jgi:hypothetical protein
MRHNCIRASRRLHRFEQGRRWVSCALLPEWVGTLQNFTTPFANCAGSDSLYARRSFEPRLSYINLWIKILNMCSSVSSCVCTHCTPHRHFPPPNTRLFKVSALDSRAPDIGTLPRHCINLSEHLAHAEFRPRDLRTVIGRIGCLTTLSLSSVISSHLLSSGHSEAFPNNVQRICITAGITDTEHNNRSSRVYPINNVISAEKIRPLPPTVGSQRKRGKTCAS